MKKEIKEKKSCLFFATILIIMVCTVLSYYYLCKNYGEGNFYIGGMSFPMKNK